MAIDPKLDRQVDAEAGDHDLFYIRTSSGHTNDDRGLVLKEIASDTTVDQVKKATGADLILEGPIRTF